MKLITKIKKGFFKIWKDEVGSSVISAGVIFIITLVWAKITNNTWADIYKFIVDFLAFRIPVYIYFSAFGVYFILSKIVAIFKKKKNDPFWDEPFGNYTFKELYNILLSSSLEVANDGMKLSGRRPPNDNLLLLFQTYYLFLNRGVGIDSNIGDGRYLYTILAPRFVGFGLVDTYDKPDDNLPEVSDIAYKTSELGHRFHSRLDKLKLAETMERYKKGENVIPGT